MNKKNCFLLLFLLTFFFILVFPFLIFADTSASLDYNPMENLPGFGSSNDFGVFISNLYKFGIWTVGICALLMIVIGGYFYAASGGNNATMQKAKGFITDAIIGLILALLAYLILYIINPELVKIKTQATIYPTPTPAPAPTPAPTPAPGTGSCSGISSQKPGQCKDASPSLTNLLSCMNSKLGNAIQISSISDGNGGVNCYQNNPTWAQCTSGSQKNCCFHKKNSCHYGGTSCAGSSSAVDFSNAGSSAPNSTIISTAKSCGANYTLDEGNHVHVSTGGCNCK